MLCDLSTNLLLWLLAEGNKSGVELVQGRESASSKSMSKGMRKRMMLTGHLDRFSAVAKVLGYQKFGTESCQNTHPLSLFILLIVSIDLDNQGKLWKTCLSSHAQSQSNLCCCTLSHLCYLQCRDIMKQIPKFEVTNLHVCFWALEFTSLRTCPRFLAYLPFCKNSRLIYSYIPYVYSEST